MNKEIKLHLGCGQRYLSGYIHIDQIKSDMIDYQQDISKLPQFEDNTVDLIYCCGAIAYFDREEVKNVLAEWRRVLKFGGSLKLSTQNFESIVQVYRISNNINSKGILGPLFGKWPIGNNEYIYQRTVYDFNSLKLVLQECNFNYVKEYDCDEFLPYYYDDYSKARIPHMDKNGIQMCINIEGIK